MSQVKYPVPRGIQSMPPRHLVSRIIGGLEPTAPAGGVEGGGLHAIEGGMITILGGGITNSGLHPIESGFVA